MRKQKRTSISYLLQRLVKTHKEGLLTYKTLVKAMGEQAYGLIIILFALPSALPISALPGVSFIFSVPIIFIAVHIIMARPSLWLPVVLARQRIEAEKLANVVHRTTPYLKRIEILLKPRWQFLSSPVMERVHGIILLGLGLLLMLPIPFSNFVLALLIILFGLGLSEKDGLLLFIAYCATSLYLFLLANVIEEIFVIFFT
ncbi:ABC transporter permease [Legionella donaldsonii]|uniref:ABC transporter permease n=1 Tax=Legionella donaldsonii TaxID=45060 RepID=A0A378J6Z4_9GAMM|nr:exopolysaccharide biosynthesis protein [Legionella donaldsonii]STX40290.1 ABC transporter permease [Legionella donaldsonii]